MEGGGKDVVKSTEGQAMLIKPGLVEILPSCSAEAVIGLVALISALISGPTGGVFL